MTGLFVLFRHHLVVLAKEIWAGHFTLCGPDFLLGQMQTCQRFGLKLVTVLGLLCGCERWQILPVGPQLSPLSFCFPSSAEVAPAVGFVHECAGFAVGPPQHGSVPCY